MAIENNLLDEQVVALQFQQQDIPDQLAQSAASVSGATPITEIDTSTLSQAGLGPGVISLNTPQAIGTGADVTFNTVDFGDPATTRSNLGAAEAANPPIVAGVIPLAKITGGGADGSITVNSSGVITAYTAPT